MSGFSGINQFGSLTMASGQKITFKDIDKLGEEDGKITQEEYEAAVKEYDLDKVELSTIDKNGDQTVSEDEFAIWEQKIEMQTAVNNLAKTISKDFAGKSSYISEVSNALKEYIDEFADTYTEDVSGMAEAFKDALPAKYTEIKTSVLANDSDTIRSNVLEEIYTELTTAKTVTRADGTVEIEEGISEAAAKSIQKKLQTESTSFIKSYTGTNLEADLKAHLEEYMNKSDAEKLADAAAEFEANANTFGNMIDDGGELTQLKEYAKEFLMAAIDAGVTVKFGNSNIKTEAAITSALNKFTDGDELKSAIEDIISGLSTTTLKESIVAEEKEKAEAAELKKFTDIKGSEYQVDTTLIDYSKIDGYMENETTGDYRGKGWDGSKKKAMEAGEEYLNDDTIKEQIKNQIKTMLEEKGVSFDKIETVFENVYSQSIIETLNSDGIITGRGARGLSSKGKAHFNKKEVVDKFITTFNTNIAKAIDEMNASSTDMDTIDLDYNSAVQSADDGTEDRDGLTISEAYQSGATLTMRKKGAEYYVSYAENMIDNMKSQLLTKAMAMCEANGIEFDNSVFTTMFNNAKSIAVNACVAGVDSDGKSFGGVAASTSAATGIGLTVAAGSVLGEVGISSGAAWVASAGLAAVGPVGWVVGGVAAVATAIGLIGTGHHSESYFNPRECLNTFTEQFKTSYTAWVEKEKSEAENNKEA